MMTTATKTVKKTEPKTVTPEQMHWAINEGYAWIVEDDGFMHLIVATRKAIYHFSPTDQLYIEI